MEPVIDKVFVLEVEEPEDDILTPQGVIIAMQNQRFTVFSTGANHNLFRAAIHKLSWDILERGASFRNYLFRTTDVTSHVKHLGLHRASDSLSILQYLYDKNPRQYYFLQRYVLNSDHESNDLHP